MKLQIKKQVWYRTSNNEWVIEFKVNYPDRLNGNYRYSHKTKIGAYFNLFWFGYSMLFNIIKAKLNLLK